MDVIPLVLNEEMVPDIPLNHLKQVAECSSVAVKKKVQEYLSSPGADARVKEIVQQAYQDAFQKDAFYKNGDLVERVKEVGELDYTNVSAAVPTERLQEWRKTLLQVFESEYAAAYTVPVTGAKIDGVINAAWKEGVHTNNAMLVLFAKNVDKHKSLFKDRVGRGSVGTPMKRVMLDEIKYRVILQGIEFLLTQRQQGFEPETWRIL